jgi:class 3 adenylate cyclase
MFSLRSKTNNLTIIVAPGIPDPIEDHASVLTQFSFEARDKVREVCAQLDAEGLDTHKLDVRFGIHSGAITAGILRGTKSRFELFGDTINTASRMESTSVGGKIQVSAETAELIRLDRREQWLVKRDAMVTAKGKGQLQTYWVEPNTTRSTRVSFSDEALDHTPDSSYCQTQESDRYLQHEYDKKEESGSLFADENV